MPSRADRPGVPPRAAREALRATGRAACKEGSSRLRSPRPPLRDEAAEHRVDLPRDRIARSCRIDDLDACRMALRETEIGLPHALEEFFPLSLETVMRAIRDPRPADLDGGIEQQRQIRLEAALHAVAKTFEERRVDPSASALIRERRIGEAIANDPFAALERRLDHERQMLRSRREHQQGFGLAPERLAVVAVEQEIPQALAEHRASRLARDAERNAQPAERLAHGFEARRLTDALDS